MRDYQNSEKTLNFSGKKFIEKFSHSLPYESNLPIRLTTPIDQVNDVFNTLS